MYFPRLCAFAEVVWSPPGGELSGVRGVTDQPSAPAGRLPRQLPPAQLADPDSSASDQTVSACRERIAADGSWPAVLSKLRSLGWPCPLRMKDTANAITHTVSRIRKT